MRTRVAVMAIIVEKPEAVEQMNTLLHGYAPYIIGRMGIPHRQRGINLVSVALDAPQSEIERLTMRLNHLRGVSIKTTYA